MAVQGPLGIPLSDEERSILVLLADGATDGAVARHLSVSMRTYRRRLRALMEKLDATSRFQAGVRAAQGGLIELAEATERRNPRPPTTRCSVT
jgi:DNA-binding NarL/FixJ family response regulator